MRCQEELVSPRSTKEDLIGLRGGQPGKVMFHLSSLRQLPIGSPRVPAKEDPVEPRKTKCCKGDRSGAQGSQEEPRGHRKEQQRRLATQHA